MTKIMEAPLMDVRRLPIEKAVTKLIEYAVSINASDLFFVTDEENLSVQVRHLGVIQTVSAVPLEVGRKFFQYVKANASMDVTEKRRPLDGRWIMRQEDGPTVDLRINVIPTINGEDLAMRLLVRESQLFTLENLGLTNDQHTRLLAMLDSPSGLVLMTGPTGSGKTATLYASLMRLNNGHRKINTIEDPIEYALHGLRQSQVNTAVDLGFSELLRSVLRQSPDVIMIGEVRDAETAETAVRAANSGHLVLATIHAPTAAGAVQSMRALGVHGHFLSTALRGVVSQRLVRTLCPKCKSSFDLTLAPHTFDDVRPWLTADEGNVLYAAKGCELCNMTGYSGRTGAFEVMPVSRSIRNMISEGQSTRDIRGKAIEEKMLEFRQSALLKVALGLTSTEEVFRVIPSEHLLLDD
jgi:type II secretory ATPase GspE/PulE/Tfp pilus assembly ATPase PilB-like protein